jgi:hypothetical protein
METVVLVSIFVGAGLFWCWAESHLSHDTRAIIKNLLVLAFALLLAAGLVGQCSDGQEEARMKTWRDGYEAGKERMLEESPEPDEDVEPKGLTDQERQQRWSDRFDNEAAIREAVTEEERAAAVRRAQENEEHWRLLEATRGR